MPRMADTEMSSGAEPGRRSGVAPVPEDHAFADMPRQAARERDVPPATSSDPGTVAADQEVARALILVERAGGQNVPRAKLAVRRLLAERDRVLREPFAPEKLAGVIKELVAVLEHGLATLSQNSPTAAPPADAQAGASGRGWFGVADATSGVSD